MKQLKTFLVGIAVGIANIIPGVSGGTVMAVTGTYDDTMKAIENTVKPSKQSRIKSLQFLGLLAISAGLGILAFAHIISFSLDNYYVPTMYLFIGLITGSIPLFISKEVKDIKLNWIYVLIGVLFVVAIAVFAPNESLSSQIINTPELSFTLVLKVMLIGLVAGFTMLLPGISGSMVLLLIGYYELFTFYIKNVTDFKFDILLPLVVIGIGVAVGIFLSAKVSRKCLKSYKTKTLSVILGLIVGSIIAITMQTTRSDSFTFDFTNVVSAILAFVAGVAIVMGLDIIFKKEKIEERKENI